EAIQTSTPTSLLLGFKQGQWFLASQGDTLKWITSLTVNGSAQAWGTDGTHIYQLFGASDSTAVSYKIVSKLYPLGYSTTMKPLMKVGVEIQASREVSPTFTVESERSSVVVPLTASNVVTWVNSLNQVVTWQNSLSQLVTWLASGTLLNYQDAALFGHYLGW